MLNNLEIDEIEEFVDISISNFNNARTPSEIWRYLVVIDSDDMRRLCIHCLRKALESRDRLPESKQQLGHTFSELNIRHTEHTEFRHFLLQSNFGMLV